MQIGDVSDPQQLLKLKGIDSGVDAKPLVENGDDAV
jgi:hypothetical protein